MTPQTLPGERRCAVGADITVAIVARTNGAPMATRPRPRFPRNVATLRANKSETFDCLKFTLEGAGNHPMVVPERLPSSLSSSPEGPATPSSAGRVVAAPVVASAEFTAGPKRRSFTAQYKLQILSETDRAVDTGGISAILRRDGPVFLGPERLAGPA